MVFPKCDLCGHTWHGLPCPVHSHTTGQCGCVGAFEDDYWKEDAS